MKSAEQEVNEIVAKIERYKERKEALKQMLNAAELELTEIARECEQLGFSISVSFESEVFHSLKDGRIKLPLVAKITATKINKEYL